MVNVISRNGDRLLALADDLLVLATFDHDSWQDLDSKIDLRSVVQESEHAVASMLATRQLDVTYSMPPEPVLVNGDATHLERAVTNLLSNAVKFTLDGGSILVTLEADAAHRSAVLSVTDTGLGIPESDLESVFGRFYRTAVVQEHAIQGSGLGLAIVKTIVESHEGRIDVRSAPGEGTTFTITLPLTRTAARLPAGASETESGRFSRG
jgi:signal transduction histidine kinase